MRKNALIIGATSAIAHCFAKDLAKLDYDLILVARSFEKLNSIKNDIMSYYSNINISLYVFNALEYSSHNDFIGQIYQQNGNIDLTMIAYGSLPNQEEIQNDNLSVINEFEINALSVISISTVLCKHYEKNASGKLVVITSVAGDRGRKSNYIYGAAKGALNIYLQGLRNRFGNSGIKIITVKPGFVDTPMTSHLKKNFLFSQADEISGGIIKAIENNKDIVYLPSYWRYIMFIIKLIPESIFKKLSL